MDYFFYKRKFDILFSFLGIIFLMPVYLIISLWVKTTSKGPIIYKGLRAGRKNKNFYIYKFRTMVEKAELLGGPSTALNDPRLTSIGRVLRKYKLDELPQLFNVLLGDMSIVGPRPLPSHLNNQISNEQLSKRQSVRPGLTGLSQINYKGKKRLLDEKVVLDLKMIINFNIFDYFKIIILTIPVIFKRFYYNVKGKTL